MEQIINQVCHVSSHENVELVEWEGKARLAHPHLETWEKRGVPHLQGQVPHTHLLPKIKSTLLEGNALGGSCVRPLPLLDRAAKDGRRGALRPLAKSRLQSHRRVGQVPLRGEEAHMSHNQS